MISEIKKLIRGFILRSKSAGIAFVKHQLSKKHIKRILKEECQIFLELGAGDKEERKDG
jgi:hypothetical protein